MKKIFKVLLISILTIPLVSCAKSYVSDRFEFGYEESEKFSNIEIEDAIEKVKEEFDIKAATLEEITYSDNISDMFIEEYQANGGLLNGVEEENIIVLKSVFYVDNSGRNRDLIGDFRYENYPWILIRDDNDSEWEIDKHGY